MHMIVNLGDLPVYGDGFDHKAYWFNVGTETFTGEMTVHLNPADGSPIDLADFGSALKTFLADYAGCNRSFVGSSTVTVSSAPVS